MDLKEFVASLSDTAFAALRSAVEARTIIADLNLTQEEANLVSAGNWIQAIKKLRVRTGLDLVTAKDVVYAAKAKLSR